MFSFSPRWEYDCCKNVRGGLLHINAIHKNYIITRCTKVAQKNAPLYFSVIVLSLIRLIFFFFLSRSVIQILKLISPNRHGQYNIRTRVFQYMQTHTHNISIDISIIIAQGTNIHVGSTHIFL